jgi:hypothetical protein
VPQQIADAGQIAPAAVDMNHPQVLVGAINGLVNVLGGIAVNIQALLAGQLAAAAALPLVEEEEEEEEDVE